MKRYLCVFLAALLTLSCMTSALASAPAGAEEETLYQQYGPWNSWTQEQKDAAGADWDQAQWDDYWQSYEADAWQPLDAYYADYEQWSMEYGTYEGMQDSWQEELSQTKAELGMPYPGINVSLNGEYLDFGGVEPVAEAGRTLVPFRPFLEGLGAQVSYDEASGRIEAVLPEGTSMTLWVGQTRMEYTEGERIQTLEMDAAPCIRNGQTYIPVRFAAEALGLEVSWDAYYETVHLTDVAALVEELDGQLSCANEIYAALQNEWQAQLERTCQAEGEFRFSATLYGEKEHATGTFGLSLEGLGNGQKGEYTLSVQAEPGALEPLIRNGTVWDVDQLAALDGRSLRLLFDLEQGSVYYKGDLIAALDGSELPGDTWVSQTLEPLDLSSVTWPDTLGQLMWQMYGTSGFYLDETPWQVVMQQAEPVLQLLGDSRFTRTVSGEQVRYDWTADLASLVMEQLSDDPLGTLMGWTSSDAQVPSKMELKGQVVLRGGRLEQLSASGELELDSLGLPAAFTFALEATPDRLTLNGALTGEYMGKVELEARSERRETAEAPRTTPPEGEAVESYDVLTGLRLPGVPADFGGAHYVQAALDARYGKAWDADYLAAVGMDQAALEQKQRERDVAAFCDSFLLETPGPELEEEIWALLREIYARTDYTVKDAGDGTVEVTARPLDVFDRVWEVYWQQMDGMDQSGGEDWSRSVLELCREQLEQAEYGPEEQTSVQLQQWEDGTVGLDRYELELLHSTLILPSAPSYWW
ncbi:copper amine oxidase N-terminal domain-containing protein [Flavonifractor hominis]|uniref:Copper amine oxidase N-terminal domain-containing protein n=1 Tax=Flavonifractor hominis TaxID=3133178 RepID=A0ABV1ERI1_9FIRM